MKKVLLIINLLLVCLIANAQIPTFNWANTIGSTGNEEIIFTAVASDESVFTVSKHNNTNGGILIKKFSASGAEIFTKAIGAYMPNDIYIDGSDNIYVCGDFMQEIDFDANVGVSNLGFNNYTSLTFHFLIKYSPDGNLLFAKQTGGTPLSITTDQSNNVYLTGTFKNTEDFDPSPTVTNNVTSIDGYSMFITKLNNVGDFVWNKVIGKTTKSASGFARVEGNIIRTDANNNLVIAGAFSDGIDFDLSSNSTIYGFDGSHTQNPFTLKLDNNGEFLWAKYFASNQESKPAGMELDAQGNIYTTGIIRGQMDFDSSVGTLYLYHQYQLVPYVSKMDSNGNILWAKQIFSVNSGVELTDLKLDRLGNIFTLGTFNNTINYTTTTASGTATVPGAYNQNQNIFLASLNANGMLTDFNHFGGTAFTFAKDLVIKNSSVYIAGAFSETVDFDMSANTSSLTATGNRDNFISKYTLTNGLSAVNFAKQNVKLQLYPNPTTSGINVMLSHSIESGSIKIISLTGQTMLEKQHLSGTDFNLDVSGLSNGNYIIQLKDRTSISTSKFIKQ